MWSWVAAAWAGDLGTVHAAAFTAIDHGMWAGCTTVALSGEPDALTCSAATTHIALLTTPVFLLELEATNPTQQRRMDAAWVLYWTGVGVTAAGWAALPLDDDAVAGRVLMTAANAALIGAAGLAAQQALDDRRAVVIPVASGTF